MSAIPLAGNRSALLLLVAFAALPAQAQYVLRADVVSNGATVASGNGYTLRGTVSEPVAGPVAGGAYALGQGFWYPATAGSSGTGGPLVDLTLTPTDPPPPVVIVRGELLRYRAEFAIAPNGPSAFPYWADARLPNGQWRHLYGPVTVNGTPGTTVTRNLQQRVPNNVPLGSYVFRMQVGTYPSPVLDEDGFPVTVIAGEPLAARTRDAGRTARRVAGGEDAARRAAAVRTDVPAPVARRIAAAPDEWWAWDEDGTVLEAGLVQDLRAAPGDTLTRAAAEDAERVRRGAEGEEVAEALPPAAPQALAAPPPTETTLAAPFPNPSDGRTTLRFGLPVAAHVRLAVYDALGRAVVVLVDGAVEAGWHEAAFEGTHLPAGVYVARLEGAARVRTQRLTVVR